MIRSRYGTNAKNMQQGEKCLINDFCYLYVMLFPNTRVRISDKKFSNSGGICAKVERRSQFSPFKKVC